MSKNSAYRNQAWGGCYAGAEGGDLALPLVLGGLDVTAVTCSELSHHLHLPAALQPHHAAHHHVAQVHLLQRLVRLQGLHERLSAGLAEGIAISMELRTWYE